jgi:hypothetical protein
MAKSATDLHKNANKKTMSVRELEAQVLMKAVARLVSYQEI